MKESELDYTIRDNVVNAVKIVGEYLVNNADKIVGDWHRIMSLKMNCEISFDRVPCLSWEKTASPIIDKGVESHD